jgi:cytochrome c-type biogenesis protein CcmH
VRIAAVVAAALVFAGAASACAQPRASLPALEGQIMCLTCHTTLDQSDAPFAQRVKHLIQVRIDQCKTSDQIKAELVGMFGAGILAAPPRKGFDLLAWWLPLGGILAGALLLAFGVWRWTRARGPDDAAAAPLDPALDARVDELLAKLD